jgi:AraC family transcriptional regulator
MQQVQTSPTEERAPALRAPLPVDEVSFFEASSFEQLKMAVTELFKAVSCALRDERDAAEQFVEHAANLLNVGALLEDFDKSPIPLDSVKAVTRSGLAPWQIRKVRMHLESNLGAKISTQDLASIAGLSPFHFSRAFRDSFGDSPHSYLLRRRIEQSQGLMLTTRASLADIALECGLVDQAHFGKLFRRLVGESPGVWRRARANQDLAAPPPLQSVRAYAT